jgi:hypothetical protein
MSTRLGKELATRMSGGIRVTLRWRSDDDRVVIVVEDPVSEEIFELEARRDNALDVYYHPFAYMAGPRAA